MVGGAPVNDKYANDIGADGYAQDAGEAIDLAKKLLTGWLMIFSIYERNPPVLLVGPSCAMQEL